jgi:hypothetical protein
MLSRRIVRYLLSDILEDLETDEYSAHCDSQFLKPILYIDLRRYLGNISLTGTEPALSHLIKRHDNEMETKSGEWDHGQQVALQVIGRIIGTKI